MYKRKKFHSIFPIGENVHLVKDVGMIPFMLQNDGYYESSISFYEKKEKLPYLKDEVEGLKYVQLKKIFKNEDLNIFSFLLLNFWKYDFIMMFHPSFNKLFIANFFRILSFGKLKFYFKLDLNESSLNIDFSKGFKAKCKEFLFSNVHLNTVETEKINKFFNTQTAIKCEWLPNGFKSDNKCLPILKEKVFITVGRVGLPAKDTETLMKALSEVDLEDWKCYIIGPFDELFTNKIKEFYLNNPKLIEKVFFMGNITSRAGLDKYYSKAKIFLLTSKFESFGLVMVEAIAKGCYIISTDLLPSREILDNGKYGKLFPIGDSRKLSEILQNIIDDKIDLPDPKYIKKYADDKYDWAVIVKNLYHMLEK